jgi:histidyl-tRNA synthetase
MSEQIQPRVLKGFRDFLPGAEMVRAALTDRLTECFRRFGFVPIDTPVLEYADILLRKSDGETEKQVFRFTDNGGRDVALRFDLTVPFARFIAEHHSELYFPFKRYHVAKVWRGEKPQAGRYREFVQCDFDMVGSESASSDFEILSLIKSAFEAIGVPGVTIRINHRGVFNAFLECLNVSSKSDDILRIIDKLSKIGRDETSSLLTALTGSKAASNTILDYAAGGTSYDETLALISGMAGKSEAAVAGIERLRELRSMMKEAGIEDAFVLDPSITRGLDYYTGVVYETFLDDLPGIGSVCSGGRYDNLAALYMKERVPGVGASIGLDRLIAALEQLGRLPSRISYIDAEIFCLDALLAPLYRETAAVLRSLGIECEVFPDAKKISQQYEVAEKKGVKWGVLIASKDAVKGTLTLKNLTTREQFEGINAEKAAEIIKST